MTPKPQKPKGKKQQKSGQARPPSRATGKPSRSSAMGAKSTAMQAYDRMIRDPCAAAPSRAPYQGTDSGYVARTVDYFQPTCVYTGTGNQIGSVDAVFQVTPKVYLCTNVGPLTSYGRAGSNLTIGGTPIPSNFVKATAKRWRPLACCLKWIPNGAPLYQTGTVSLGYSASSKVAGGDTTTSTALETSCLSGSRNGAAKHEIRWLPSSVDQEWTDASAPTGDDYNGATVFCVLSGVDATVDSTAGVATFNGRFQVTTIWEWEPPTNTGAASAPIPPPPFSINEHQATIPDMGKYLLDGVRTAAKGYKMAQNFVGAALAIL